MTLQGLGNELLKKRDLSNFVSIRTAHPGDDLSVGDLLVRSFREANQKKLPMLMTPEEREIELRDVNSRRRNGIVRIMELGFQIIGTYSLIQAGCALDDSWTPNTCTLRCLAMHPRFQSLKLSDQLLLDAISVAKSWNASSVCLHVQSGAAGVAKIYEHVGFNRQPQGDKMSHGNPIEGYVLDLENKLVEKRIG
ncbi:MAG: GNAT family N-acetyltransferase [Bdellovibrionales bacterium]